MRVRRPVRLTVEEALIVRAALTEWRGYLAAGGWDETDVEAEQYKDAVLAHETLAGAMRHVVAEVTGEVPP